MSASHWPGVKDIDAVGIATGHATGAEPPPTWSVFDAGRLREHRFVALGEEGELGWAAVSAVSERCVDAGVGRVLLDALVASTESAGIWAIQCGVFPENLFSLALQRRAGFREVGVRRLGWMRHGPLIGRWRDVILLGRRSETV